MDKPIRNDFFHCKLILPSKINEAEDAQDKSRAIFYFIIPSFVVVETFFEMFSTSSAVRIKTVVTLFGLRLTLLLCC
jgi:hypothetical protein